MTLVSTTLLSLALGASVLVTTPASATDFEVVGPRCSHTASNDPTGLIQQNPDVQVGEIQAGPVVVVTDGIADPVTIVCTIQINDSSPDISKAKATAYSAPMPGGSVLPPTVISYVATPTDNVYECTGFWFKLPDGTWIHKWDAAPNSAPECQLAVSVG